MTAEQTLRRRQEAHERYIANREERLANQLKYYQTHREQCIASVMSSEQKRILRKLWKKKSCVN